MLLGYGKDKNNIVIIQQYNGYLTTNIKGMTYCVKTQYTLLYKMHKKEVSVNRTS